MNQPGKERPKTCMVHKERAARSGAPCSPADLRPVRTDSPLPRVGSTSPPSTLASGIVLFTVLGIAIGQSLTFALLAPLSREIGLKETQVGLIITLSSLVFTFSSPAWGRRCDRWGRKPIMLIGQLGYAFGATIFASVFFFGIKGLLTGMTLYLLIIAARMLMGALMSAAPGAASAYIADTTTPEQRTAGMGRFGAAKNLGTILGPAVSGIFATIGLLAPLYIIAGTTLVTAVLIAFFVREPQRQHSSAPKALKLRFLDRRYFSFILIGLITFTAYSMMTQTIGFYLQDKFTLDGKATAQAIGLGMMVSAMSSLFCQGYLVRRFRMTPSQLLKIGLPTLMVGYVALVFGNSISMIATFMGILGLGMGLVSPGFSAGASLSVSAEEQGAIGGLLSACPSGGYVLGPILGTALYQLSPTLPYFCCSALMVGLVLYVRTLKATSRQRYPDPMAEL